MTKRPILLICGSVREGSTNAAVLATVKDLIPAPFEGRIYAGLGGLPMFDPDLDRDPLPAKVASLRAQIADAAALIFSTPEYAGAMPGALKNLLEWTVGGVETSGKPCAWINPSTGPTAAAGTYESLGIVLRYTDATVVEEACIALPVPRSAIVDQRIADPMLRERLAGGIERLLAIVTKLATTN